MAQEIVSVFDIDGSRDRVHVRNLDPRYFNDNSTQSLIRISLTLSLAKTQGSLSLAKTQGSVYVRVNRQIVLN